MAGEIALATKYKENQHRSELNKHLRLLSAADAVVLQLISLLQDVPHLMETKV